MNYDKRSWRNIMFDFIFGGSKKVQLVKDLIIFLDRGDYPNVEDLNRRQLFNTPEAIIVDLMSSIYTFHSKKGFSLYDSVQLTERGVTLYGKLSGHPLENKINEQLKSNIAEAVMGMNEYVNAKIYTAIEKPFLGVLIPFTLPLEYEVENGCHFVWERLMAARK
jgi:hypothetical protein